MGFRLARIEEARYRAHYALQSAPLSLMMMPRHAIFHLFRLLHIRLSRVTRMFCRFSACADAAAIAARGALLLIYYGMDSAALCAISRAIFALRIACRCCHGSAIVKIHALRLFIHDDRRHDYAMSLDSRWRAFQPLLPHALSILCLIYARLCAGILPPPHCGTGRSCPACGYRSPTAHYAASASRDGSGFAIAPLIQGMRAFIDGLALHCHAGIDEGCCRAFLGWARGFDFLAAGAGLSFPRTWHATKCLYEVTPLPQAHGLFQEWCRN